MKILPASVSSTMPCGSSCTSGPCLLRKTYASLSPTIVTPNSPQSSQGPDSSRHQLSFAPVALCKTISAHRISSETNSPFHRCHQTASCLCLNRSRRLCAISELRHSVSYSRSCLHFFRNGKYFDSQFGKHQHLGVQVIR